MNSLKIACISLFITIGLLAAHADNRQADSLTKIIHSFAQDTNKVKAILELGKYYFNSSAYPKAINELGNAVILGEKLNYNLGVGKAYFHIGRSYKKQYNFEKAISNIEKSILYLKEFPAIQSVAYELLADCYYDKVDYVTTELYYDTIISLANARNDTAQLLRILTNAGNLFFFKGDFQKSTFNYTKALKIAEAQNDSEVIVANLNNLANSYTELNEYAKAIQSATKAKQIAILIKDYKKLGIAHDVIASNYMSLNLPDSAKANYRKAIYFLKITDARGDLALALKNLADYFYLSYKNAKSADTKLNAHQLLDSAKLNLSQALKYANEAGDDYSKASILNTLGYINSDLKNQVEAKKLLLQSLDISQSHGFKDVYKMTCTKLAKVFYELNDYKNAYLYSDTSRMLEDSIINQEKIKVIGELTTKYQTEKKEQQLKLLAKDAEANALLHAKETQKKKYAYLGMCVLLLGGSYTYWLYSKRKKLSIQLTESLLKLNRAQEQLIVTEKEKEAVSVRLRIAQDIHDEVGSNLTKISMLSKLISSPSNTKLEVNQQANKLAEYSRELNQSMSEIIWAANPKNDSLENLLSYLRTYAQHFFTDSGVILTINFPNQVPDLNLKPDLKRNIYLIAKEALNNALKHAQAQNVSIDFSLHETNFELCVTDDGKGFIVNEKINTGNGIQNITQRVKSFDGKLEYKASPGLGCCLQIKGEIV